MTDHGVEKTRLFAKEEIRIELQGTTNANIRLII